MNWINFSLILKKKSMLKRFFIITTLLACTTAFASTHNITLPGWYRAKCSDYTGTWHGFISDPNGLFGDGGPWQVSFYLYEKDNRIVGENSVFRYTPTGAEFMSRKVYAQCKDGKLSNIYWLDSKNCGSASQQGVLISKNTLALELRYDNAMTGTNMVAYLQRQNSRYPHNTPKSMTPGSIQRCQ